MTLLIGKLNQKCQDSARYLRKNIRRIEGTPNVNCIVLANAHFQTHLKVKATRMDMKWMIHLLILLIHDS